ncbi:DNA-processing protein DprA [Companilactobacillus heilongjiangensis]|uniref:DNA-processing protein DprA n=2 Tax=Lactobacillaceae TaxID=33958 RepID=UPI00146FD9BC|nr:DNA-processing protein DprA [Companilactobacillus heilongjiangensis]
MMLLKVPGIGGQTVRKIMEKEIDVDKSVDNWNFLSELEITIVKKAVTSGKLSDEIWNQYHQEVLQELEQAKAIGVEIISYLDESYPQRLLKLQRFPVILYAMGNIELLNAERMVTIVGTRKPTEYGIECDIELTEWLSLEQGYVVVSGLAQGCDAYTHGTAEKTIAVVAHGLDQPIYPRKNAPLAKSILEKGGLLITTYPLGTKIIPQHLAARDEWQSGLGDGVIVIETGLTGGTHTTISYALKQSKPLAILKFDEYCKNNFGNEKLLNNLAFDGLNGMDTCINFVKRMQREAK